jgi:hypothetical protein
MAIGFVAVAMRRWSRALVIAAVALVVVGSVFAMCDLAYGDQFILQAVLFHFLKGRDATGAGPSYVLQIVDVIGPLFGLGVLRAVSRRDVNSAAALIWLMAGANWGFYSFVSPTGWAHNYLEGLPFIAVIAGSGTWWVVEGFPGVKPLARHRTAGTCAAALLILGSLVWITPLRNENWLRSSAYGFGYVPRAEIAELSNALRQAAAPGAPVIAPPFLSFEANRVGLIRYPENFGVVREAERRVRSEGFAAARRAMGDADFFALIDQTNHYWNDEIISGIAVGGSVNAVIFDSPIQLLPLTNATPEAMLQRGFQPLPPTPHYLVWLRGSSGAR